MKGTIVTGSLIVFSDGFVWKRLSNEKAYKIWVSAENEDFELYKVRVDEDRQEMDTKHLDCLAPMRKLELQEYLSQDVLAIEHSEYYKQLIGEDEWCEEEI